MLTSAVGDLSTGLTDLFTTRMALSRVHIYLTNALDPENVTVKQTPGKTQTGELGAEAARSTPPFPHLSPSLLTFLPFLSFTAACLFPFFPIPFPPPVPSFLSFPSSPKGSFYGQIY